jgi:hypothetical protein
MNLRMPMRDAGQWKLSEAAAAAAASLRARTRQRARPLAILRGVRIGTTTAAPSCKVICASIVGSGYGRGLRMARLNFSDTSAVAVNR